MPIGLHEFMATGDMPMVERGDIARFGLSESMLSRDCMLLLLLMELLMVLLLVL